MNPTINTPVPLELNSSTWTAWTNRATGSIAGLISSDAKNTAAIYFVVGVNPPANPPAVQEATGQLQPGQSVIGTGLGGTDVSSATQNVYLACAGGTQLVAVADVPTGSPNGLLYYAGAQNPVALTLSGSPVSFSNPLPVAPVSQTLQLETSGNSNAALAIQAAAGGFNPGGANPAGQGYLDMGEFVGGTLSCDSMQAGISNLLVQVSDNLTNWGQAVLSIPTGISSGLVTNAISPTPFSNYILPSGWRYIRIVPNGNPSSGNSIVSVNLVSKTPVNPITTLGVGTSPIGGLAAIATGGATIYRNLNLGATGINVKASGGNLDGGCVSNTSATDLYLKLYNKASAPTVGTDTPAMTIYVAAKTTIPIPGNAIPAGFLLGIGVAATANPADADTTAPGANACVLNLLFS